MRIALGIEYDGSQYHGWQAQSGLHTVQNAVDKALSKVADEMISVTCAGRTDTGVHAINQVVHFDSNKVRTVRAWVHGANSFLPKDISVRWAKETSDSFHARYSAIERSYRYVIFNAPIRPALCRGNVTWQYRQLNHEEMHKAAQILIGEHDFTSFRSVECQSKTPMRKISLLSVRRSNDYVLIDVTANAFLHHMVRNIAGVLIAIGSGKQNSAWIEEVLQAKDRRRGADTAPPYGLYLRDVGYPKECMIPAAASGLLFDLK